MKSLLSSFAGKPKSLQPPPDEFADELRKLFYANPPRPCRPHVLTEIAWSMSELISAVRRMKVNKAADEVGLVVELLQHAPNLFLQELLRLYNHVLHTGDVPTSWHKTVFRMLAKFVKAKATTDFRPIADVRLLYKTFACLVLGRIESVLDAHQPEEQHGFRKGRRIEEHLLTANTVLDKTLAANIPLWVISIDFSKAFDRVSWTALWSALAQHGVSAHLIWILQELYAGQLGVRGDDGESSRLFQISGGVRQGCVLSPRLFCAVLQLAMGGWRRNVDAAGIDLYDNLPKLLDVRFADDVFIFTTSSRHAAWILDELVRCCSHVGLILNPKKTKIITTEAQAQPQLTTPCGLTVEILSGGTTHRWLGCLVSDEGSGNTTADVDFHLQSASRAFHANRHILCDRNVSVVDRLKFFDRAISPIACFAAGHRTIYSADLHRLDVHFRKHLRQIVGAPPDTNWDDPWHDVLHHWNVRAMGFWARLHRPTWSSNCLRQHWNLAMYVINLPSTRWVKRVLAWDPVGTRVPGRPKNSWATSLENFARWKGWNDWQVMATNAESPSRFCDEYVNFMFPTRNER